MSILVLTANLGNFDTQVDNTPQSIPHDFYRFTDKNFPPCVGLTPRLQYRIPKLYGWQMKPGYNYYIWIDGSFSLQNKDSVKWFIDKLGDADIALFIHPWRKTIKEEVDHIEDHLKKGKPYITSRYKNGFHKEMYEEIMGTEYKDTVLYTSTAFIYKSNDKVKEMMNWWWLYQSRYFTCDQVALPFVVSMSELKVNPINENQYRIPYLSITSKHK